MMLDKIKNKRVLVVIISLFLLFLIYFSYYLYQIYTPSKTNLDNNNYDAAIVLTGDQFRIQKGISLLRDNKVNRLLISGVNKRITKKSIIAKFSDSEDLFNCCIDLEMISTNTFENAKESYMWTRGNKLNSIIVVSSFYHLPRAKLEFGRFYKDKSLIFLSANDNLMKTSLKKLFIEYIKYIRTSLSILIGL
tara:strand:- start:6158 stop:6733 length:576 start_codon:yes stop_codon:yes gene_type:complete